ncbi:MAG: nuclear transport factor 2 family protein [Bacteroidota bacterium]
MKTPKETVIHLFVATDQRNWDDVREAFHNKVLLDYSSMTGNAAMVMTPDQIIAAWRGILPGFEATHHQVGNFLIQEEGPKSHILCYGTATHYLGDESGNVWTVVGSYDFELNKGPQGVWTISAMKFNVTYQDGNTRLPEKAMNRLK